MRGVFKSKEWILWAAAALLVVLTCLLAVIGTPDMAPVTTVYPTSIPSGETAQTTPWQYPLPPSDMSPNITVTTLDNTSAGESSDSEVPGVGKINLNTADKETLMTLNGVGEVIAERILAYRETHGGFDTIEELMEVEGIGEKRFAAWEPYITVS